MRSGTIKTKKETVLSKDKNEPAFPFAPTQTADGWQGMTLRQWYIGKALVGILSQGMQGKTAKQIADEAIIIAESIIENEEGNEIA